MATIAQRLKELRFTKGIEQAELAKVAGVSRTAMGKYENGDVIPKATALMAISQAYSVSMDWLCGLTDCSGGGEIKTVYDFICLLPSLLKAGRTELSLMTENTVGGMFDGPHAVIKFYNPKIIEALEEGKKMNDLHDDNVIDNEIFELWNEKMQRIR